MAQIKTAMLYPFVRRFVSVITLTIIFLSATGCDIVPLHMRDQERYEPHEQSMFFEDGLTNRPVVANTVAQGDLRTDTHLYQGTIDGEFVNTFPFEITKETLEFGQERYNIYCAPCHGQVGDGNGMITQRGLGEVRQPTSFHDPRLIDQPAGYYYDAITNGFGLMYSYASRIPVEDRWAIVAYIRALQLSQDASIEDVPEVDLPLLNGN